jgi:hypothetical protein
LGINAKLPKYKPTRSLPYIPPEEFLDQLIACLNQMLAVFFQALKETAEGHVKRGKLNGAN